MPFILKHLKLFICLAVIVVLILAKVAWVWCYCNDNGSFETEKQDILERRAYLIDKVITSPEKLLDEMPSAIGLQFQGEWALYTCSMLTTALENISRIYPETKEESIGYIDSLIHIVLSPEIREYDRDRWREDPLESLEGEESHISYLSHLALMIGRYKSLGGGNKFDALYHSICQTMNRRIIESENMNLQTYPEEFVYVPDMLVGIVALDKYSTLYQGKYYSTVRQWLDKAKTEWINEQTGLLSSFLGMDGGYREWLPVKGSYSALNCYYLTLLDEEFAKGQYDRLKDNYLKRFPFTGFKEYDDKYCLLGLDIDAGPIIFNLSPSGTAFAVGSITHFNDSRLRRKLLKTAEIAGTTISGKGKRHYLLADVALVGEAIMLAMRTNANM